MPTHAKKKQKVVHDNIISSHNFVSVFWSSTTYPQIGQFLGVNDKTNLSMVCKELHQATVAQNLQNYHNNGGNDGDDFDCNIVWEKREDTRIGLERVDLGFIYCKVAQIQQFTFNISDKTLDQKIVVELSLENLAWIECFNSAPEDREWLERETQMRVIIKAPKTYRQERERIFLYHPNAVSFLGPFDPSGPTYRDMVLDNHLPEWTEEDKLYLRRSMRYIYACAKRISKWQYDDTVYPSAEYLMRDCLPRWLHPYFPNKFDWRAEHVDRNTQFEFEYRPARDLGSWFAGVHDEETGGIYHVYCREELSYPFDRHPVSFGMSFGNVPYYDSSSIGVVSPFYVIGRY